MASLCFLLSIIQFKVRCKLLTPQAPYICTDSKLSRRKYYLVNYMEQFAIIMNTWGMATYDTQKPRLKSQPIITRDARSFA